MKPNELKILFALALFAADSLSTLLVKDDLSSLEFSCHHACRLMDSMLVLYAKWPINPSLTAKDIFKVAYV
ncbi:hypothetical protein BC939DRAFT_440497 [Gamsiella multidivaricata]|uniref:uncharacterized protein n=1 Tax=Gamsiella multidivaricata TaxID=101098 RepID=UPI0022210229|nr:uncharacterized protein BC939DRAFT_440497 [Gamsiella multidivaricata]KAI7829761.1 hypothetical protein BC939DRAFT_440497 [Gamsiella multidivaricata]